LAQGSDPMDYAAEKREILAETDFWKLSDRLARYADITADAARQNDVGATHDCIRLGHWVIFREADFTWGPFGPPIVDDHQHAIVGDTPAEAFAAAVEMEPPPMSFNEAMTLARACRSN
jgi:hypothetical protein